MHTSHQIELRQGRSRWPFNRKGRERFADEMQDALLGWLHGLARREELKSILYDLLREGGGVEEHTKRVDGETHYVFELTIDDETLVLEHALELAVPAFLSRMRQTMRDYGLELVSPTPPPSAGTHEPIDTRNRGMGYVWQRPVLYEAATNAESVRVLELNRGVAYADLSDLPSRVQTQLRAAWSADECSCPFCVALRRNAARRAAKAEAKAKAKTPAPSPVSDRDEAGEDELEGWLEAVAHKPQDMALRARFGEWLRARKDPRGEVIAIDLSEPDSVSSRMRDRKRNIERKCGLRWAGRLREVTSREQLGFRAGFAGSVRVSKKDARVLATLGDRAWATVESLAHCYNHHFLPYELVSDASLRSLTTLRNVSWETLRRLHSDDRARPLHSVFMSGLPSEEDLAAWTPGEGLACLQTITLLDTLAGLAGLGRTGLLGAPVQTLVLLRGYTPHVPLSKCLELLQGPLRALPCLRQEGELTLEMQVAEDWTRFDLTLRFGGDKRKDLLAYEPELLATLKALPPTSIRTCTLEVREGSALRALHKALATQTEMTGL